MCDVEFHHALCITRYVVPLTRYVVHVQYLLSRDWAGLKWHPVLKVWEHLQDKHSE